MVVDNSNNGGGLTGKSEQNPIEAVQAKFKEVEIMFRGWLAKQSLPVEAAIVTVTSGAQGAAIGGFMGTLTGDASSLITPPPNAASINPDALASLKQAQMFERRRWSCSGGRIGRGRFEDGLGDCAVSVDGDWGCDGEIRR
ncbi:hypothetical protein CASFOL_026950 [Castilleja foliolosa]|uniref:Uncharacterized protein n=1 Tax=Castilleja foliolosa TaxID=1961234 RepID=A0ABD3CII1_9LAMI